MNKLLLAEVHLAFCCTRLLYRIGCVSTLNKYLSLVSNMNFSTANKLNLLPPESIGEKCLQLWTEIKFLTGQQPFP